MRRSPFRRRKVASFLTTIGGALLLLAISASIALAVGVPPRANVETATICHVTSTPGVPAGVLTVPVSALNGHFAHGDYIHTGGPCPLVGDDDGDDDPIDVCPSVPGDQAAGPCAMDACPDVEGFQVEGPCSNECTTDCGGGDDGDSDPVDACPDALNPGIQPAGTTCVTSGGTPPGGSGDTPPAGDPTPGAADSAPGAADSGPTNAGGDDIAPGVEVEAESLTLGVQHDGPATIGSEVVVAGAAEAGASGTGVVAGAAAGGGNSAIDTPSGELPYTGGPTTWVAVLGSLLVALGMASTRLGARAERRMAA